MSDVTDQRPPVAVGHVRLNVVDVGAAARWLATAGLRPIVTMEELAVLELRGGTHVVVRQAEPPPKPGTGAPFDLMVDDVDAGTGEAAPQRQRTARDKSGFGEDRFRLRPGTTGVGPRRRSRGVGPAAGSKPG